MANPFSLHNLHLLEAAALYHPQADLTTFQAFQTDGRLQEALPGLPWEQLFPTLLTLTSAFSTARP